MSTNEKEKKVRTFFGQRSYHYDTHDKDGNQTSSITVDEWKKSILDTWSAVDCEWGALIFHDSDVLPDGNLKPLHAHVLMNFKSPRYGTAVGKLLGISRVENLQACKSIADSARYLTHMSETAMNEGKTIYSPKDVVVFGANARAYSDLVKRKKGRSVERGDLDDEQIFTTEDKQRLEYEWIAIYDDIIDFGLTADEAKNRLIEIFGDRKGKIAWRMKREQYAEDFKEYMTNQTHYFSTNSRPLTLFYISGDGGMGKTLLASTIANILCDSKGVHKVAPPGRGTTFDFAGGYKGERVTVANDFPSGGFPARQFNNVFDPYESSPVNSRNFDKSWFARYCLITNSEKIETFINNMIFFTGVEYQHAKSSSIRLNNKPDTLNMIIQVRRRFKFNLILGIDPTGFKFVEVQKLSKDFSTFERIDIIPYTEMYVQKEEIAKKVLKAIGDDL